MNIDEAYVSIADFAKKLNVHSMTVRRAIKSGRIQAFRIGSSKKGHWRIPMSEIGRITLMDMLQRK